MEKTNFKEEIVAKIKDNFPKELIEWGNWVVWRYEKRDGQEKPTKPPYSPNNPGHRASPTDPSTWSSFEKARDVFLQKSFDGLGFMFGETPNDTPFVGVDLDNCCVNEGELSSWSMNGQPQPAKIIEQLASYTEYSPSKNGVHVIARGGLPPGGRKKGPIEMYNHARYFTVRGDIFPNSPCEINSRNKELEALHKEILGKTKSVVPIPQKPVAISDSKLLEKAKVARDGKKFTKLWDGNTEGYPSESEADLALCSKLAFWTNGDAERINTLFCQSGLMRDKWDRDDYRRRTIEKALETFTDGYTGKVLEKQDDRTEIRIGVEITEMTDQAEKAILGLKQLYQRAGMLCRITRDRKPSTWLKKESRGPSITNVPLAHLEELASRGARWVKAVRDPNDAEAYVWIQQFPHIKAVKALMARGQWQFPPLEGLIYAPTLRPDGSILDKPGYDKETGLIFEPGNTLFPKVPEHPTLDDAINARKLLEEVFYDFPFIEEHHKSTALAAVLSCVGRNAITGYVPLFTVRAPTPGSGKTLLVDTIATIATGHGAPRTAQADKEEEDRKRLLVIALEGDPIVLIDNVEKPLGSGALATVLTAGEIRDRVLGKSEQVTVPWRAVMFATGNNLVFKGDLGRRVVPIDIDPKEEIPEERKNFKHVPLLSWTRDNWPKFEIAALTILRAYHVAGRPNQNLSEFGSFEEWSNFIRGSLVWTGMADPCKGREKIRQEGNIESENLRGMLNAWYDVFEENSITLALLKKMIVEHKESDQKLNEKVYGNDNLSTLFEVLEDAGFFEGQSLNTRKLGWYLRKHKKRIFDEKCFELAGEKQRAKEWRVTIVS